MCSLVVRRFSEMHRHFRHPKFEFHNRFGLMRLIGCLITFALIIIDVTSNKLVCTKFILKKDFSSYSIVLVR